MALGYIYVKGGILGLLTLCVNSGNLIVRRLEEVMTLTLIGLVIAYTVIDMTVSLVVAFNKSTKENLADRLKPNPTATAPAVTQAIVVPKKITPGSDEYNRKYMGLA